MKLLITGGAVFVGARLARTLLQRGPRAGKRIERFVIADQFAPPPDLAADPRVEARTGALLAQCAALHEEPFDGVFHLASAVSGECEADFELGLRSNLDSTRALLDALRARTQAGAAPAPRGFSRPGAGVGAGAPGAPPPVGAVDDPPTPPA